MINIGINSDHPTNVGITYAGRKIKVPIKVSCETPQVWNTQEHMKMAQMNFTLQPFAKETLTGPQRAWSSRDNIHTHSASWRGQIIVRP